MALIKRDKKYKYREYTVQPKDKIELLIIINETIEKEGPKCDLNFIDTSRIKDMSSLFNSSIFNGDISRWDVSNAEDMHCMFLGSGFNGDISEWDVGKVRDMTEMFFNSGFDQDISKWDVKNVRMYRWIFNSCPLKNQPDKQPKFNI